MTDELTESFLNSLMEAEIILLEEGFEKYSFLKKGFAYYSQFKRKTSIVEFMFGPPEFQIEPVIYTKKGKFEFKDLLLIDDISDWIKENRYTQAKERNLKNEIDWLLKLIKISLPLIE